MSMKGSSLVSLPLAALTLAALVALVACESAVNLDVEYADAAGDAGVDGEAGPASLPPNTFPGCPCNETAGVGCCIPKVGNAFCTADTDFCVAQQGMHLKCGRPDPASESTCCWHLPESKTASGAVTALAGACHDNTTACAVDSDCAGTGHTCATKTCAGVVIGQCAATPPPCAK